MAVAENGAYFFQETVAFFLRLFLSKEKCKLKVKIEENFKIQINGKFKNLRPDISILNDGKLIAIIELKVQLGFDRNDWEAKYNHRKKLFLTKYPNLSSFLVIFTGQNWDGFKNHFLENKEFFTLTDDWPRTINYNFTLLNPIEPIFLAILNKSKE
jgi:hypothetical protein